MTVSPGCVNASATPPNSVQVAVKNMTSGEVAYFQITYDLEVLFSENGKLGKTEFITEWKNISDSNELYTQVQTFSNDVDAITERLGQKNVFDIARRTVGDNQQVVYLSLKTVTNVQVLLELTFTPGQSGCRLCIKMNKPAMGQLFQQTLVKILG